MLLNWQFVSILPSGKLTMNAIRNVSSGNSVLLREINNKGIITLNRPKVLNAMNDTSMREVFDALKRFDHDKTLVILKGSGTKAYCAGGDLKMILETTDILKGLLKYLNASILLMSAKTVPTIAFIDGITLGGGVGLSVFGKYQVATERTLFGMPETKIGYHPNAGASYFFTRMKGRLGWYLGLTGRYLNGRDAVRVGLASHYCNSSKLPELEEELLECRNDEEVASTLDALCDVDLPEFSLHNMRKNIETCFSAPTVEDIFSRLSEDGSNWAKETIETLSKLSPTSLKVTLKQLDRGRKMSLRECLLMEFNLSMNFWKGHDVSEGIRARLIDKDHNPRWSKSTLSEVSEDLVESYFVPNILEKEQREFLQDLKDLQ